MKTRALIASALCSLAMGCREKPDTPSYEKWPRTIEARLTGSAWERCEPPIVESDRVVTRARCGGHLIDASRKRCDRDLAMLPQARMALAEVATPCLDDAVATFERYAREDVSALNDLSVAYFMRAQRDNDPRDLVRALSAAEAAAAAAPKAPEPKFNRALLQEALGLTTVASASWDAVIEADERGWRDDASERRQRLLDRVAQSAGVQWERNAALLPAALSTRDRTAVARLIAPARSAAEKYLFETLLPKWSLDPSEDSLAQAKLLAEELSRLDQDPFAVHVVRAITPATEAALRDGHRRYPNRRDDPAVVDSLMRGASPLALDVQRSRKETQQAVEQHARAHGYLRLLARLHMTRAYTLHYEGRFQELLTEARLAVDIYRRLGDAHELAWTYIKRADYARYAGHQQLAWSDALRALRGFHDLTDPANRHYVLGVVATLALALDQPRLALQLQSAAVDLSRDAVRREPKNEVRRKDLAIALRERARFALQLGTHSAAKNDFAEAKALLRTLEKSSPKDRQLLESRMDEVEGELTIVREPERAIEAYTRALNRLNAGEQRTFRAILLLRRADACQRLERMSAAEADRRLALQELRKEEMGILEHRTRGEGEDLWSVYFSRFQDTYQKLIRDLRDRPREAFAFAERARAFEPLDLVLQLRVTPRDFPRDGEPLALERIQKELPPDTYILLYSVGADDTYTWLVSRDHFELFVQPSNRITVAGWTSRMQRAAPEGDAKRFQAASAAAYVGLVAQPMEFIARATGNRTPRLVFVPDGAMHGLPLTALRNADTGRYLIEEAEITVAASATLYVYALLRDRELPRPKQASILLIGDPKLDPSSGHPQLPSARDEVTGIAGMYEGAKVRIGADATVADFLARAPHYDILHIAAHAEANPMTPHRSRVLLAESNARSGTLEAQELLTSLRLDRTRLVVLSACSSAGGLPVGPEGVAPLVRPFVASGVPAVIGSLWDVEDATTATLLVSFHRHHTAGMDAVAAMRAAQLQMLRNGGAGSKPVFAWSAFQVIGHASSPNKPPPQ